ncbi:lamin tail domain-containing protein [Methyloversatilis thermotolerans]|uniref:lamin tail domain-containing protein n=1 Tax=Methyloversatilis thermotolerans TaxID=1346290 RepID=UPI0003675B33|nr:lamin tail domain-containing protein [Methyloversatilis thermotolerans]
MKTRTLSGLIAAIATSSAFAAGPDIQITEWMYNGADETGEYIEFTNMGSSAVDFAGWSFDDSSRAAGSVDLSAFGIVLPGQSVILTEAAASAFRAAWSLDTSVKVIGGNTNNLGRGDEINLYDASGSLVDRLTYGDNAIAGTVRAQNASGNPSVVADLVPSTVTTGWVLASAGDSFGSYASSNGDIGNPGSFIYAPVPEPTTHALMLAGLAIVAAVARRRFN